MSIVEVVPGAKFGALTVKGREGSFNGETTWRCEDEKGRSVVFPESEIVAMYVDPEKVVPYVEPEKAKEPEGESEAVDGVPDTDCDKASSGAAVVQSEPKQEEKKAEEVKPKPKAKKKKSASAKTKKDKKRRK